MAGTDYTKTSRTLDGKGNPTDEGFEDVNLGNFEKKTS